MKNLDLIVIHPKETFIYKGYYLDECLYHKKHTKRPLGKNIMDAARRCKAEFLMRIDDLNEGPCQYQIDAGVNILKHYPGVAAVAPFYQLYKGCEVGNFILQPQGAGIIYRRKAFLDIKYDEKLDYQADLDFYIRFTRKYTMSVYPGIYRWDLKNSRSLKNLSKILSIRAKILKKYDLKDENVHHFGAYAYV